MYPYVEDTLRKLKEGGARLFVASNGLEAYVKGVAEHHNIAAMFDGIYSAGEYGTASKVELVARLIKDHGLAGQTVWMVGDRSSDVEAGRGNGLKTVGCAYAKYGKASELERADVLISDFRELLA